MGVEACSASFAIIAGKGELHMVSLKGRSFLTLTQFSKSNDIKMIKGEFEWLDIGSINDFFKIQFDNEFEKFYEVCESENCSKLDELDQLSFWKRVKILLRYFIVRR